MRCLLLLLFCLPILGIGGPVSAEPPAMLSVSSFAQLLSDRYTTQDGLPGKNVTDLRFLSPHSLVVKTEAGQGLWENSKWRPVESGRQIAFDGPAVDAAKLPHGAKVWSAALAPDKTFWIVTDQGAFRSEGERYIPVTKPTSYLTHQMPVDIDATFTCVAVDSLGQVWFGTTAGVYATDGKNWWNPIDRRTGLPVENVTCIALGANADLWVGTTEGVCQYTSGGVWHYYGGPRWLPNNHVNALTVAPDGSAWIATQGGVAHLYQKSITLAQKAAHYQQITEARHNRRGFVTGGSLKKPGDVNGGMIYEASDNDGLWTAVYVGAQSFRYAATKDPQARAEAKKSMWAMLDLVKYSGVPGFPARAIVGKDEKDVSGLDREETVRIPGETDKIWFVSPVDPNIWCKGDTSSDEMDGHYFAWYVFYELVADAEEKKAVAAVVRAVTDNILDHDLFLVGPTGRPTRWGVWNPKQINDNPEWWEERGLNALEMLAYLKVAHHICGDARYEAKYRELITKHHYLLNTVTQKVAEPWYGVNHSDDQMAFMIYYALVSLEKESDLRRVLLQSLERSWKIERPEFSPFFNFVYGATTGRPCDLEGSVATLQGWPWELIDWQVRNAQRVDVTFRSTNGQTRSRLETETVIPVAERHLMRWNGNPYEADGGSPDGNYEEDGSAWLLPYWMGRYHRLITE